MSGMQILTNTTEMIHEKIKIICVEKVITKLGYIVKCLCGEMM